MVYRYNHPRTGFPKTFKSSASVTSSATVKEINGSTVIADGGEVIGYTGVFGVDGKVVLHDGADATGTPILTVCGQAGSEFDVHLQSEHWREYADGLYAAVTGTVVSFVVRTLRDRTRA